MELSQDKNSRQIMKAEKSEDSVENKTELLKEIKDEILNLKNSPLYSYRTENKYFPVIGEGSHDAKIMFVGEAPGKNEAETGKPFCGTSGKMLDEFLNHVEIKREDVYITNVVKDRPQNNRPPTQEEIEIYGPFLDRQIEIIKPKIISALGKFSSEYLMNKFGISDKIETITKMHGKVYSAEASYGQIKITCFVHPSFVRRNLKQKAEFMKGFEILKNL
jgi:DNA polymerase